ncbi:MAG: hypothetical protein FD123_1260 [Bacteroidetes bacterium]|nr:MAG: hypothetical protein FD123_1260 [Bacteroidota bacterium]
MKKLLTIATFAASFSLGAQGIWNPGFENWNTPQPYMIDTLPQQWSSFSCGTTFQTTDAIEGNYAVRIAGMFGCGISPGLIVNGSMPPWGNIIQAGTPFTSKPASVSGFYKLTDAAPGDSAVATIILKKWNAALNRADTVAIGVLTLPPVASYTMFTVSINDLQPAVQPDSIIMAFESSKYYLVDLNTMVLPSLYIDKIKMPDAAATGITGASANAVNVQVFPNPFTSFLQVEIDPQAAGTDNYTFSLYDLSGKEVCRLENQDENKITISRDDLAAGTYLYRIRNANGIFAEGKVIAE